MTELERSQVNSLDLSALDNHVILMTGGTGFVGSAMLEAFRQSRTNAHLYITSRRLDASVIDLADGRIHLIPRYTINLPRGITDIIHLEPDLDWHITKWVADMAVFTDARVLYASSGAALMNTGQYADSKRLAEQQLAASAQRFCYKIIVARLWAFVGPHLPIGYAVTDFIRDGLAGGPIIVQGDGKAVRSYMYTTDLAEWMWTLLMHERSGQIYNVGSDDAVTIGDLAIEIASKFGCRVVVVNDPDIPSARYVPDTTRTRQELGLSIKVSRSEAIDKTIAWYRERRGDGNAINSFSDQIR